MARFRKKSNARWRRSKRRSRINSYRVSRGGIRM